MGLSRGDGVNCGDTAHDTFDSNRIEGQALGVAAVMTRDFPTMSFPSRPRLWYKVLGRGEGQANGDAVCISRAKPKKEMVSPEPG